ncbi:hypothetical protein NECAME_07886 [Necator americanus]|uniref:Uncharacterized protein n=1 Tax=Necator americanus TaxID=51031 RepID=W2TN45_NECAM|nr:hypothetical protein NECAME_07886 [Necator americanus]ETN82551.1 hypothetical protein NECAME_07886 [Necator americanus]
MADDYINRGLGVEEAIIVANFDVADRMLLLGKDFAQIVVPPVDRRPSLPEVPVDYRYHESEGSRLYGSLNTNQKGLLMISSRHWIVVTTAAFSSTVLAKQGKFISITPFTNLAVEQRRQLLCVAWTGIADNWTNGNLSVQAQHGRWKSHISDETSSKRSTTTEIIIWD